MVGPRPYQPLPHRGLCKSMSKIFYHIADKNPCFLINYKILVTRYTIGNLSKDVFERRTSTGSEAFSHLICLDANKFVLLSFFPLIKTIYPRVLTEPLPNDAKSPLVDVRRSKLVTRHFSTNEKARWCLSTNKSKHRASDQKFSKQRTE